VTEDLIVQTMGADLKVAKFHFLKDEKIQACKTFAEFLQEWRRQYSPQKIEEEDSKALAIEYCKLLLKPKEIYPGEETVKILAEELKTPMVVVNGDSLRYFGPEYHGLPIFIYKTPGNANYNRLIVDQEQWDRLYNALN
jgi:hypothetical protein